VRGGGYEILVSHYSKTSKCQGDNPTFVGFQEFGLIHFPECNIPKNGLENKHSHPNTL
jgi:hypothetical protein